MGKERKALEPESQLFREAVGEVTPVKAEFVEPERGRVAPIPHQRIRDEGQVMADSLYSDEYDPLVWDTDEDGFFARPGLSRANARRLRRGQFAIAATLDMHGLTSERAQATLSAFLREARERSALCVRVIHGKGLRSQRGEAVLKVRVARWLRQREDVLAYCTARPEDGGSGALYVLLRRQREA